jgi:hypothetical protein
MDRASALSGCRIAATKSGATCHAAPAPANACGQDLRPLGENLSYIGVELPALADVPSAAEITVTHTELVEAKRLNKEADRQGVPPLSITVNDALERAEKLAVVLCEVLNYHEFLLKNPWLAALSIRWMQNSQRDASPTWLDDVITESRSLLRSGTSLFGRRCESRMKYLAVRLLKMPYAG